MPRLPVRWLGQPANFQMLKLAAWVPSLQLIPNLANNSSICRISAKAGPANFLIVKQRRLRTEFAHV